MGEHARIYTLERFGVDIGDDNDDYQPKKSKRFGCHCGKSFRSEEALYHHKRDTGHVSHEATKQKDKS